MRPSGLLAWLRARDRNLAALRRAGRTAIVMPGMFALGIKVIGDATVATFAAFGAFSMLLLVDFSGPMRERLQAQATLALTGGVFVCLGTLASRDSWLAAAAMVVLGFAVLFAGVVSSVLAGASTSLLLAFILPVSLAGPVSSIPDRLEGWALASGAALLAVWLLWPAPSRDPLRVPAIGACRAMAARLRADVAFALDQDLHAQPDRHAIAEATAAVNRLHEVFIATPYRPTGLSSAARTIVRLVDELSWLNSIAVQSVKPPQPSAVNRSACAVKSAAAGVLERGAALLEAPASDPAPLREALLALREALTVMEATATRELPVETMQPDGVVSALDPSFRAQELSFAVAQIGANIDLTAAAERRSWRQRLLGQAPVGLASQRHAAQERAAAHLELHSVWLHNSVRGAIGLGLAVFIADRTGVQHSFWVVLGTLSVLRSNALSTGQNVLRGIGGTVVGFAVGAVLLVIVGTNPTLLWLLLPLAILFAGVAPAAISFAAGQAAFTLALVILFNIIQPVGWRVGLLRVEDIALGGGVSLVVGLLFWPRGAGAALGRALAEAYVDSAAYLASAVNFGVARCDAGMPTSPPPAAEAARAAGAARRLDDTFRAYLAERGAKKVALAEVTGLVTGVAGLRLAGDAVLDLWQRDHGEAAGNRFAARQELSRASEEVNGWYRDLAASLVQGQPPRDPVEHDPAADARLVQTVYHDLRGADGAATATAVRVIWTGDHLDAARRLQKSLIVPARAAARARTSALLDRG